MIGVRRGTRLNDYFLSRSGTRTSEHIKLYDNRFSVFSSCRPFLFYYWPQFPLKLSKRKLETHSSTHTLQQQGLERMLGTYRHTPDRTLTIRARISGQTSTKSIFCILNYTPRNNPRDMGALYCVLCVARILCVVLLLCVVPYTDPPRAIRTHTVFPGLGGVVFSSATTTRH